MTQLMIVLAAATVTALATGLGAAPFAWRRFHGAAWLARANAIASGVMLGASASLLVEAGSQSVTRMVVGGAIGVAFVAVGRHLLAAGAPEIAQLTGGEARKALLIIAVMTAHSAAEGVGVGAAFGGGDRLGVGITLAIAIHNIPEGLAISLVLVPRGSSVRSAALWSVFTSLPQPLLAVPAYLFVEQFHAVLPVGLSFAAGAMVWMVWQELLPESGHNLRWIAGAFAAMVALQTYLLA